MPSEIHCGHNLFPILLYIKAYTRFYKSIITEITPMTDYGESSQDLSPFDSFSHHDESRFLRLDESSNIEVGNSSAGGLGSQVTDASLLNERKYLLITNDDLI